MDGAQAVPAIVVAFLSNLPVPLPLSLLAGKFTKQQPSEMEVSFRSPARRVWWLRPAWWPGCPLSSWSRALVRLMWSLNHPFNYSQYLGSLAGKALQSCEAPIIPTFLRCTVESSHSLRKRCLPPLGGGCSLPLGRGALSLFRLS